MYIEDYCLHNKLIFVFL